MMLRVLFVCSGNTCRSPMAQLLLQQAIIEKGWSEEIQVVSAGVCAAVGEPVSEGARLAMQRRGIDALSHSARLLDGALVDQASLILVMTKGHAAAVGNLYPSGKDKTYTLAQFCNLAMDVQDPFGGDEVLYEQCAAQLAGLIDRLLPRLIVLLKEEKDETGDR